MAMNSSQSAFADLSSYEKGSARVFQSASGQTAPVVLSSYGGVGYMADSASVSGSSAYGTLASVYGLQPQPPSQAGYKLLNSAYNQSLLFSAPYSAKQCLNSPSIFGLGK